MDTTKQVSEEEKVASPPPGHTVNDPNVSAGGVVDLGTDKGRGVLGRGGVGAGKLPLRYRAVPLVIGAVARLLPRQPSWSGTRRWGKLPGNCGVFKREIDRSEEDPLLLQQLVEEAATGEAEEGEAFCSWSCESGWERRATRAGMAVVLQPVLESLVREQRTRFYLMRRWVAMIIICVTTTFLNAIA
ncbi:hypothetical protein BHM03_00048206 [Ensete ventricosum]|nr:hypothetical protein BHM03_00048206 [Ensete ventricosum]